MMDKNTSFLISNNSSSNNNKSRRVTLSPALANAHKKTKLSRNETANTNNSKEDSQRQQETWTALCPAVHPNLGDCLARLGSTNSSTVTAALEELATILNSEKTNQAGTTLALFYAGGHKQVVQCLKKGGPNSAQLLETSIKVLHLLACRSGYYHVPEVLGVSCLHIGLTMAGAMADVLRALAKLLQAYDANRENATTSHDQAHQSLIMKQTFEIMDSLLTGLSFPQLLQLKVPQQAIRLAQQWPGNTELNEQLTNLFHTILAESRGATDPEHWNQELVQNACNMLTNAYARSTGQAQEQAKEILATLQEDILPNFDNAMEQD